MAKYFTPIAEKSPANAETFNAPMQELDNQIDENAQQIASAGESIESLQSAVQGISSEISGIKSKQAADEADITALDAAVAGIDDDLTDVATDVSQLKTDMTSVQGRMQTAEGNISTLQTATGGLQTDIDELETDLGVVEGTVEGLGTDIEGLDSRMATAEGDIDTLEAAAEDLDERVTELEQTPGYELPAASSQTLGGVKVGSNLSIDQDGVLSATDTTYSPATSQADGLMSASDKGKLDGVETGANAYTLPAAGANSLGGVKVGSGLSIDANGVLSADGGAPIYFGVSDTAASTVEKAVSISGITEYTDGMIIFLLLNDGNSVGAGGTFKININNIGAKNTNVNVTSVTKMFIPLVFDAARDIFWCTSGRSSREANVLSAENITAASDTDTALDVNLNKTYLVNINGVKSRLVNYFSSANGDVHEQYLYSRPAAITPGQQCAPIIKYRCRLRANYAWGAWTEWTVI